MTASCSCSPGACHGGHTIDVGPVTTRLTAVRAWMLAHDWTETSEGDSGWMWQHTTGRKVAVFRDLTDPHAWEGLIGRLAVAHARHPGDIEQEIRGGDEPVRLADEQLRRLTQYVHPDEATDYVRAWIHSMAGELLAARARFVELENAKREPIGYQVLAKRKTRTIVPRYTTAGGIWDEREPVDNHRAHCEDSAAADPERFGDVEYVVAELREVGERG